MFERIDCYSLYLVLWVGVVVFDWVVVFEDEFGFFGIEFLRVMGVVLSCSALMMVVVCVPCGLAFALFLSSGFERFF